MTGLTRVEHEIAMYARANVPSAIFAFWDSPSQSYRHIRSRWLDELLTGRFGLSTFAEPPGPSDIVTPRSPWHRGSKPPDASWAGWLAATTRASVKQRVGGSFLRANQAATEGTGPEDVLGPPIAWTPGDRLFMPASDWWAKDPDQFRRTIEANHLLFTALCHDLIPDMFPDYYRDAEVKVFRKHWETALAVADHVVVDCEPIGRDVQDFARRCGLREPRWTAIALTAERRPNQTPRMALPRALTKDRFILFVSTIEPRKGHDVALEAWDQLLAQGVPQESGVTLVLAGRIGWMVAGIEERLAKLQTDGHLVHLPMAPDAMLATLYENCLFTIYPSRYEGFGMPIVESLEYGKPVIISNAAPVVAVGQGLAMSLPLGDAGALAAGIRELIDPTTRHAYQRRIAEGYRSRSWNDYGAELFALLDRDTRPNR